MQNKSFKKKKQQQQNAPVRICSCLAGTIATATANANAIKRTTTTATTAATTYHDVSLDTKTISHHWFWWRSGRTITTTIRRRTNERRPIGWIGNLQHGPVIHGANGGRRTSTVAQVDNFARNANVQAAFNGPRRHVAIVANAPRLGNIHGPCLGVVVETPAANKGIVV
jgi:hypothetical protein